jgi:putative hydrolase of the HAD superfamily
MKPEPLVIGFDADDTLWHTQPIFERSYERFCELLSHYHDPATSAEILIRTEMKNIPLYGYGVKGFTLSAIETAIELSGGKISSTEIRQLIAIAQDMLVHPVNLLDGVVEAVSSLSKDHTLLIITKGDLQDQQRKIRASGLAVHFSHIEIVSEKDPESYRDIYRRHGIAPERFLMVGNSIKSDIVPVLETGGFGVHIPYHVTWAAEMAEEPEQNSRLFKISHLDELPEVIRALAGI